MSRLKTLRVDAPRNGFECAGIQAKTGLIDRLRIATADVHRNLDQTLHILERLSGSTKRPDLVAGYYTLHSVTEAALKPFLSDMKDLRFGTRCKSPLLAKDLADLDFDPALARGQTFAVQTPAEAMGALYVLEGSTLGGKAIIHELEQRSISLLGLSFLNPYGTHTGSFWNSFLRVLERETTDCEENIADAVSGAIKCFAFAKICLSQENHN